MSRIHPTAIVEDGAKLSRNVEVGPYTIIGSHVEMAAARTSLMKT